MKKFLKALLMVMLLCVGVFVWAVWDNGSHTASAEPSNIVSELRHGKAAALMYFEAVQASPDIFPPLAPDVNNVERIAGYMDNPERYTPDRHMFYVKGDVWWIGYRLKNPPAESFWDRLFGDDGWLYREDVRGRLENRAKSTGLYGTSDPGVPPVSSDLAGLYKQEDAAIWMRAR